jgi:hypothetical protein
MRFSVIHPKFYQLVSPVLIYVQKSAFQLSLTFKCGAIET